MVIFICGFTGNGKTTLAKYLSKEFKIFYFDSDKVKKDIFVHDPKFDFNIEHGVPFSDKTRAKMYDQMTTELSKLKQHRHIVIDDTLHTALHRFKLLQKAKELFGKYLIIQVKTSDKAVKIRLQKPRKGHMIKHPFNMHKLHKKYYEPLKHIDLILNNDGSLENSKRQLNQFIKQSLLET